MLAWLVVAVDHSAFELAAVALAAAVETLGLPLGSRAAVELRTAVVVHMPVGTAVALVLLFLLGSILHFHLVPMLRHCFFFPKVFLLWCLHTHSNLGCLLRIAVAAVAFAVVAAVVPGQLVVPLYLVQEAPVVLASKLRLY